MNYVKPMEKEESLPKNFIFNPKQPPLKCTSLHPPLAIKVKNKTVHIHASSCLRPNKKDAQIFISLDGGAPVFEWEKPWVHNTLKQQHVRYFVPDMSVPEDPQEFDLLLNYTIDLLEKGTSVHVGCLAGHGRTGLFLAALVEKTMGEELQKNHLSAIDYVRDNYCAKAVETLAQVFYLNVYYGVAFPKAEKSDIAECQNILEEQTGYTYKEIIKAGLFLNIIDTIDDIELNMDMEKNPQHYEKQNQYAKGFKI